MTLVDFGSAALQGCLAGGRLGRPEGLRYERLAALPPPHRRRFGEPRRSSRESQASEGGKGPPYTRACVVVAIVALIAVASAVTASAQENAAPTTWTYRVRVGDEATATRANTASPFRGPNIGSLWDRSNQIVATGDGTWTRDRLHTGVGIAVLGASGSDAAVRVRQAYARVSATSWVDVEAGKRLVRWGTGYAFTPTGLLDPPRSATDPQDRLGSSEGMALAQATFFRGGTALTVAAPRWQDERVDRSTRLFAAKLRTAIHGFELALVASGADRRRLSAGANFTHVIGERLEWHGEWLAHDRTSPWVARLDPACPERCRGAAAGARTMSALIGLQYTSAYGVNVVLEGYRDGNGLDAAAWQRLVGGARAAMAQASTLASTVAAVRPSRRDFVFMRAARASSDARWKPELMTILGVDDGSVTIVPTSGSTLRLHVDVYVRGVALTGASRSEAREAPARAMVMLGLAIRY
jgi:hypothetical protein